MGPEFCTLSMIRENISTKFLTYKTGYTYFLTAKVSMDNIPELSYQISKQVSTKMTFEVGIYTLTAASTSERHRDDAC